MNDNPIIKNEKAEAIQKSQESFLNSSLTNGNLSLTMIGYYHVMTAMMTSEMKGFNEKLIGNDRSVIDLNEYKMKKKEKKHPVQMQRKHSPTLCAPGYSFKMSMDIVPNGGEILNMNRRKYCDKNMFYEEILIGNECEDASCGYVFDILKAANPLTPHATTENVFCGEKHTQTAAQWMKSADKLKDLELQQATRSQHNYGCDSHEMDANQKKK